MWQDECWKLPLSRHCVCLLTLLAACILSSFLEESWTELYRVWRSNEMCPVRSDIVGEWHFSLFQFISLCFCIFCFIFGSLWIISQPIPVSHLNRQLQLKQFIVGGGACSQNCLAFNMDSLHTQHQQQTKNCLIRSFASLNTAYNVCYLVNETSLSLADFDLPINYFRKN